MQLRTHLDFETRSLVDLRVLGEHVYARHWSTAPLMLTYGTAPKGVTPEFGILDFFQEVPGYAEAQYPNCLYPKYRIFKVPCPQWWLDAVARDDVFVAHNARFEQVITYYILHLQWGWPMPRRWSCTAARSRYYGIRASLEGSGSDLELAHQKDARGKEFIDNFCKPRKYKGAKKLGIIKELWYEPHENPEGWQTGKEYCISDGRTEADIDAVLPDLPDFEQAAWEWDFAINTRGVPIDLQSVERAKEFSQFFTDKAFATFENYTALRPTQRERVLEYLRQREEIDTLGDLRSKTLKRLTKAEFPADLQEIIDIRLDCSLASIKKIDTMGKTTDEDGRARGTHLYGGAHTMRWSSKRIQTQNMKRGDAKQQASMFAFLEMPDWNAPAPAIPGLSAADTPSIPKWVEEAQWHFMKPLRALSQSMRGFIAAPKGKIIRAADFAQIEARVLPWLARSERKLEGFRNHQDLYVMFASVMYGIPYDEFFQVNARGEREVKPQYKFMRQVAKSAELGCGFGLGGPKFQEYCDNSDIIIDLETAKDTVGKWRDDNPEIVKFWSRVEEAAIAAVQNPGERFTLKGTNVSFYVWAIDSERYWLVCELPSGRGLFYYRPKVEVHTKWGKPKLTLTFRTEWNGKSYRESTYGGKLVENIVQAVARDILVVGGLNAEAAGYPSIMLVHDENVTLVDEDFGSHQELCTLMCRQRDWITDLPVEAEGASMYRYGK